MVFRLATVCHRFCPQALAEAFKVNRTVCLNSFLQGFGSEGAKEAWCLARVCGSGPWIVSDSWCSRLGRAVVVLDWCGTCGSFQESLKWAGTKMEDARTGVLAWAIFETKQVHEV